MVKFIKQLFCKHLPESTQQYIETPNPKSVGGAHGKIITLTFCVKCGKKIK